MTLIYFILILGAIVFVHELGHFLFAKLFGVYVYEFSLGMGPKIWSWKSKKKGTETEYSIRALPIGGAVSLAGEEVEDDKKIPKNRKLQAKPAWQRFLIMFFGAGSNFILAFIVLFMIAMIWGAPNMDPTFTKVDAEYPMYEAGIRSGDRVLSINGDKTTTIDDVRLYLALASDGNSVEFEIKDKGTVKVTPIKEEENDVVRYRFGVVFEPTIEKGFLASIKYTFVKLGAMFKQMFVTFKLLFTGGLSMDNLGGPVAIYGVVGESQKQGFDSILMLVALLCVNVGFINLIPFPAFDGGRILFIVIEKIKGSPINAEAENKIHTVGFILLMILILYVTVNDILRLF